MNDWAASGKGAHAHGRSYRRFAMHIRGARTALSFAVLAFAGGLAANPALAQASGCVSLAQQPVTARVDYYSQIQPIFENRCSNCHVNHAGSPSAGLDLDPERSWLSVYEGPSAIAPGRVIAVPFNAASSFLLEKVNCQTLEAGQRMPRGRVPIPLAEQALIRDWISQGASEFPSDTLFINGFETPVSR
jgi:uncharacterized membrane protein